jgi:GT2 family glycosyltransferase
MKKNNFDCVIVNYNSQDTLKKCIDSLLAEDIQKINKIIVVDNDSKDNSEKFLLDYDGVNLISLEENVGFARGCNIGATYSESEYIFFLNPDTVIQNSNLEKMLLAFKENNRLGIVGPKIYNSDGSFTKTCRNFPNLKNFLVHQFSLDKLFKNHVWIIDQDSSSSSSIVPTIIGAAFMVRKDIFDKLKGFDEDYFVYFEEVDFCYRANVIGYNSLFLSTSKLIHIGNITTEAVPTRILSYSIMSRLIYFKKHRPYYEYILILIYSLLIEFIIRFLKSCFNIKNPLSIFKSYLFLIIKLKLFQTLFKIR